MLKNIVVIGSGLAGSLICNELVQNANVTLLEAGPKDHIEYPETDFSKKHFGAVKTFCYGGGGTTNLWHNGLIPLDVRDIQDQNFNIMLTEAKPYMDTAATKLFFKAKEYTTEYETVRNEMNGLVGKLGVFPEGVDCLLYPKCFRRLTPDFRATAFYQVSEIAFVHNRHKVTSIEFNSGSMRHSVSPDVVIIAAGTLGTPQLVKKVLAAAGRPSKNIGIGLADHPMGFIGKVKIRKELNPIFEKLSTLDRGDYISRTAVRLKSECGRYTCCAFFRPALTMQNDLLMYKYKSKLGASSGAGRLKNAFSFKIIHPDILAEIYSHLFGAQILSRTYNILVLFEQKRGNSGVQYGARRLGIDWLISDDELAIYNQVVLKLQTMLSGISDELVMKVPLSEDWLWSAAHHSGTISLGDKDDDIVDANLKLKSSDNVFICDGSIIQEHSYANTGLTIGQLAFRLAHHLIG